MSSDDERDAVGSEPDAADKGGVGSAACDEDSDEDALERRASALLCLVMAWLPGCYVIEVFRR
jgi:hypothetical protein